ncbi:MAG: response regulator [Magnetococcales bacterium]|nr:response regulator [Magnetococcales bacterium]
MSAPASAPTLPRLLIIDDDITSIQLLKNILKGQGQIFFATSGTDGLSRAQAQPPDLILLDAEMPDMNGFEVCATLKADARLADIPVLFVTSHTDIKSETRALQLGAALFGGFWSGMSTAALGALVATYCYIPPYYALPLEFNASIVFGTLVYLLNELIVCSAIVSMHRFHLKAREQYVELHTLIQTIPEMIWLKDPQGIYLKCNPAFERLLGRFDTDIIGRSDQDLFNAEVAAMLRRKDESASPERPADRPR